MKVILICPAERSEIEALAEAMPLVNLPLFGKPFLHHWLEYLASRGATDVKILAADRPEQVRQIVGNGTRWGLQAEVLPESHELSCEEMRQKYFFTNSADSSNISDYSGLINHFPGFPEQKLFESYSQFFSALQSWLSKHPLQNQIGVKEIKPGVWVGLRTQISPKAKLIAPCWIGENVLVKADAMIGPAAILESGVVVENGAAIFDSWIATHTFAGSLVQLKDSLALGNTLANFRTNSIAKIPDDFLLCSLRDRKHAIRSGNLFGRFAALFTLAATFPFALITILKAKWQGHRALRARRAVAPQTISENYSSIIYFEFANSNGWWKRWPQLWNVVRGDFTWIGNRPLTPIEAGKLTNEFERLWLTAPIGLISQGDAEGCTDISSDEARAHASFYGAQSHWRLDWIIFLKAFLRLLRRKAAAQPKIDTEEAGRALLNLPTP